MNGFFQITNEYRQRNYPEGYFAKIANNSGGIVMIICGVILALMGLGVGILPVAGIVDKIRGANEFKMDISVIVFFIILTAILLVSGIYMVWYGIKRSMMSREEWIKKCAEISNYPESTVQEFDSQIMRTDALEFQLDMTGTTNVLTTDYILWGNLLGPCLIKISDIVGAYLVVLPDTIKLGNKIRPIHTMNLAIFSNHHTFMLLPARQERAEYLISLLGAKNPGIDTAGGKVLSDRDYDDLKKKYL